MSERSERTDGTQRPDQRDEFIAEAEQAEVRQGGAARLFDVRRIIGGLFVVYGVLVTVPGLFASEADLDKAQGININLWSGLGMLALGLLFLLWLRLSPPTSGAESKESDETGK